jgi:hypothetical protein
MIRPEQQWRETSEMLTELGSQWTGNSSNVHYLQDDLVRGLRTSLVEVLGTALADDEANPYFLTGVLSLARSMATLYGIPWCDLVQSLCAMPELCCLILRLQLGMRDERVRQDSTL